MTRSLLITQCLQNDFVKPLAPHEPLPNLLHVGHKEARRLMGEDPSRGPVARVMGWAYGHPDEALRVIHIRDWHDPANPAEHAHLEQFGEHCVRHSTGAAFALGHDPPADKAVSMDEAAAIYRSARQPKSFVSLDDADHLLTRREDTKYVARVISAWSSRYL